MPIVEFRSTPKQSGGGNGQRRQPLEEGMFDAVVSDVKFFSAPRNLKPGEQPKYRGIEFIFKVIGSGGNSERTVRGGHWMRQDKATNQWYVDNDSILATWMKNILRKQELDAIDVDSFKKQPCRIYIKNSPDKNTPTIIYSNVQDVLTATSSFIAQLNAPVASVPVQAPVVASNNGAVSERTQASVAAATATPTVTKPKNAASEGLDDEDMLGLEDFDFSENE